MAVRLFSAELTLLGCLGMTLVSSLFYALTLGRLETNTLDLKTGQRQPYWFLRVLLPFPVLAVLGEYFSMKTLSAVQQPLAKVTGHP